MNEINIPEFLGMLYAMENSRRWRRLRRELERRYRRASHASYRREAFVDSVLTMLWELEFEHVSLPQGD
ncbi:MAG: hypothetical protein ACOX2K_02215 [Bacillota bacterium]